MVEGPPSQPPYQSAMASVAMAASRPQGDERARNDSPPTQHSEGTSKKNTSDKQGKAGTGAGRSQPPTLQAESSANGGPALASELGKAKMVLNLDDMVLGVDNEFAAAAFRHLSKAVRGLAADHDRLVEALRKENEDLQRKLTASLANEGSSQANLPNGDRQINVEMERKDKDADTQVVEIKEIKDADTGPGGPPSKSRSPFRKSRSTLERTAKQLEGVSANESCMHRMGAIIRSPKFDSVIGAVIVANTLIMSLELEYSGRVFKDEVLNKCVDCDVRTTGIEAFFATMEHVFTGIFALELALRFCIDGYRYLCSVSNVLDAMVVIVSMVDSWVLGPLGSDVMGSVAVLRLMRLMRLAKVLRVVRVMKAFRSLRVLVSAVVNSVGALGWSMTLLFVLELVGAIFMAQVIQPFMEDETDDPDLQVFIWKHFGTWTNSMFTIFEITMAPGGFIQYRRLYEDVHPAFGMFFVLYVCVVTFAVVRVITAMFLKATLSASDSEDANLSREKSEKWSNYVRSVGAQADVNNTGVLSHEELAHLLEIDHFAEWIEEVNLDPCEVTRVFSALDQGSNVVMFSEFETALKQMRGLPRAADVVINLYETRSILNRVIRMESRLDDSIERLNLQVAGTAEVKDGQTNLQVAGSAEFNGQ